MRVGPGFGLYLAHFEGVGPGFGPYLAHFEE